MVGSQFAKVLSAKIRYYLIVFYHCSTQSANVFSVKYILGANPPKFSTTKVLCYTVTTCYRKIGYLCVQHANYNENNGGCIDQLLQWVCTKGDGAMMHY